MDAARAARLSDALGLHPLAGRVLAARGLAEPAEAQAFLAAGLSELPDPRAMKGMDAAVARIVRAVEGGERIALYGDYDVDGVTSTALLAGFLRASGADVAHLRPSPARRGVRAQPRRRREARRAGRPPPRHARLRDHRARRRSAPRPRSALDAVVVDHHTVPVELPAAAAILNPHQPGCAYPSKDLAAVGVTFSLAMALRKALRERGRYGADRPEPNLKDALDLVALGTVADVVPLVGANRILVRWGLEVLARSRRPGVRALKRVAGIAEGAEVSAGQVGFRLGPRINAAGRLDDAGRGVRLLLEDDADRAEALAQELDRENQARQEIERGILEEAVHDAAARVEAGARGLVLARDGWHAGVVGHRRVAHRRAVPPPGGARRARRGRGEGERPLHRGLPPPRRARGLRGPPRALRRPPARGGR